MNVNLDAKTVEGFGTQLERRFTRKEIEEMLTTAGLEKIGFSDAVPYWCAVGYRKKGGY